MKINAFAYVATLFLVSTGATNFLNIRLLTSEINELDKKARSLSKSSTISTVASKNLEASANYALADANIEIAISSLTQSRSQHYIAIALSLGFAGLIINGTRTKKEN